MPTNTGSAKDRAYAMAADIPAPGPPVYPPARGRLPPLPTAAPLRALLTGQLRELEVRELDGQGEGSAAAGRPSLPAATSNGGAPERPSSAEEEEEEE
eukprot:gene6603-1668_t